MYSRYYPSRPAGDIKLPQNYNGCAFQKEAPAKHETHGFLEVARPSHLPPSSHRTEMPPPPHDAEEAPVLEDLPKAHPVPAGDAACPPPPAPPKETPLSLFGGKLPFPSGKGELDFDRILLLSLILLLWGNESNTELILCLSLLLFCG